MIFKDNDIQIEINRVEVPSGVMTDTIINNGVHVIRCKKEESDGISEIKTDEKDYCHEKDIRRNYSGKTYIMRGIKYDKDDNRVVITDEEADAFIMISKRDIKEQFPELKRGLSVDTERWGIAVLERVLHYINSWLSGNTYHVVITIGDKVQEIAPIFADSTEQMKEALFMYSIGGDDELFDVIERITI